MLFALFQLRTFRCFSFFNMMMIFVHDDDNRGMIRRGLVGVSWSIAVVSDGTVGLAVWRHFVKMVR